MVSLRTGASWVARARQRSVSMPMPQSRILLRIFSRTGVVSGTLAVPTRTWLQRSITLSGAPWGGAEGLGAGINLEDEPLLPAPKEVPEGGKAPSWGKGEGNLPKTPAGTCWHGGSAR